MQEMLVEEGYASSPSLECFCNFFNGVFGGVDNFHDALVRTLGNLLQLDVKVHTKRCNKKHYIKVKSRYA